jgi:uncharacterized spore protein YtfJ
MENENFLEKFAAKFSQSASVKNVFGEPIQAGDKIIIPVAQVMFGLGGGGGRSGKQKRALTSSLLPETLLNDKNEADNEGAGGGGGVYAKAKGVYEITPTSTRFIPAQNMTQLIVTVAVGFLMSRLFSSWLNKAGKKEK